MDYDAGVVARFDQTGTYQGNFIEGLSQAEGVAFLPDGTILIGNGGTSSVKSFTPQGAFVQDFIESRAGGLIRPNALLVRSEKMEINAGMNDAWYNPATDGQGFLITVLPDHGEIFLAWFTFDTERPAEDIPAILGEPGHRWLTAQGEIEGNLAEMTIYLTQGGVFDSADPPATTDQDGYGSITLRFHSCKEGQIDYDMPTPRLSGIIPIKRVVDDNVSLCEALQ